MDLFQCTFVYLPRHHLAVCKTHQQGVLSSQLASHLNSRHQELSVAARSKLASAARAFPEWAAHAEDVVYPLSEAQPLALLPIYKDGSRCKAELCGYIARGRQNIQDHCRKQHGWSNPRKRGRPHQGAQPSPQMWEEGVWCQKFQPTGELGRLFEVSRVARGVDGEEGVGLQRALETSFAQSSAAVEKTWQDAHNEIEPDSNRYVWRKWLKRSGWARHLGHFDRGWLLAQLQLPSEDETALATVCWAVEMVIYRAQLSSSPEVAGWPAVQYVERREVGAPDSEHPFNARQTGKTMVKYSRVWLSIVCYIWRTRDLAEPERQATPAAEGEGAPSQGSDDGRPGTQDRPAARQASRGKPAYRLTPKQVRSLWLIQQIVQGSSAREDGDSDGDSELDDEVEEQLECHVLDFLLSLLDHNVKDQYYQSALVSATAVLGVDRDRGWKSPLAYTTSLSAIVTVAKMLVLHSAVQTRKRKAADLAEKEGWPQADAEEFAPSHVELVQDMVDRFMTLSTQRGLPTPMDWVLRLRAFGKKIRGEVTAEGTVQWVGDKILNGYTQYSMPALRSMIHGLVETTRRELDRDLLLVDVDERGQLAEGATPLPAIEWDEIVDNPAELRCGFNFLQDKRNTFGGIDGSRWIERRVVEEGKLREAFVDVHAFQPGSSSVRWIEKRLQRYDKALRLFREHLLVLVHMTGGAPARSTELVTVTHTNLPNSESRGLFVEDGLMVYVTMYHKGIGQTDNAKVVHRYLPREVGELLFYYLWMVLPFWQKLERASGRRQAGGPSAFIWEPVRETAWAGPQRRKKKRLGDEEDDGDNDEEEEEGEARASRGVGGESAGGDEADLPATVSVSGRSRQEAGRRPQRWGTDQVRRAIERVTLRWLQTKLNIQLWRHNTKATFRKYLDDKDVLQALAFADDDDNELEDDPMDLASGHGSKFAGQIYGRPADESPFSIVAQRQAFRRVSIAWHRFLQFSSTMKMPPAKGTRAASAQQEAVNEQFRRWRQMRRVDIQAALERLQGKGAAFRSVQRPVIEAIMQQKSPVVAVMPTGSGKSATFMLPALCSTGVTIVVVPVVALKQNMMDRGRKAGIDCVAWDSQRPHEWANLVLVVPESAVTPAFEQFVNRQRSMGRLDRIVIDECHTILDSVKGWRARLLQLRGLVKAEAQLVCLTASLEPAQESEFIRLMALPPKEQCEWFRAPTSRPNLAYTVRWYDQRAEREADALAALVEEKKRQYPPPSQIVVYADSRPKTEAYAAMLGAVCYHRNVGTPEEKLELLRTLTESTGERVFVATNALGLGIDSDRIRAVLFAGSQNTKKMRDVVQVSGRAGRGGQPSDVVFLRGAAYSPQGQRLRLHWAKETERCVRELIEGDGCMRVVIDREMDGNHTREGCEPGEEPCDRCRRRVLDAGGHPNHADDADAGEAERPEFEAQLRARRALSRREREREAREQQEVERLEEMLQSWKACCQWCRAKDYADADQHQLAHCDRLQAGDLREGVELTIKTIRDQKLWAMYSCCFECGVPQPICDSFEPHDGGWQKNTAIRCQFEGVLVASVMCVWTAWEGTFRDWVHQCMQAEGAAQSSEVAYGEVLAWMGRWMRWGGIESNKMSWVFVSFMSYVEGSA